MARGDSTHRIGVVQGSKSLTDCSERGCKVLNTGKSWSQIPKIGSVCTCSATGSSWTTRRTAWEGSAHWIGLGWDPQCLAHCNGRGCKVVSPYAARSQIPKIRDICACIATTSNEITEWMVRGVSAHKAGPANDSKCPADCIWSTSTVVNLYVAASQILKIVELRRHHARTVMNYARWTTRYGISDIEYPIWNMRNEGGLVKDGASRFG